MVCIAGVILLFTARDPRSISDLVMGDEPLVLTAREQDREERDHRQQTNAIQRNTSTMTCGITGIHLTSHSQRLRRYASVLGSRCGWARRRSGRLVPLAV
jgi:hypothetical protein